jgi:hypothetical protein
MNIQPQFDVSFAGQLGSLHIKRNAYISSVAKEALRTGSFSCGYFLSGPEQSITAETRQCNHGPRFGMPYYQALKAGKICLDAKGNGIYCTHPITGEVVDTAGAEGGSMRLLEATGVGAFLLCEEHEGLNRYFKDGYEIATYKSEKDLIEKIHYYLARPEERAAIAARGLARCHSEHSMQSRALRFHQIIQQYLATSRVQPSIEEPSVKINQAARILSQGAPQTALLMLENLPQRGLRDLAYLRGLCLAQLGRWKEAESELLIELSQFPDRDEVRSILEEVIKPSADLIR